MTYWQVRFVVIVVFSFPLIGCAGAPPPAAPGPTEVRITLAEFRIDASQNTFAPGKPYRFIVQNNGRLAHEWMIMPAGEADHMKALFEVKEDDLPPGATVTREYTFAQAGEFEFACRVPGHYQAGQMLRINVK